VTGTQGEDRPGPDVHVPVLAREALDALHVRPDGVYVDATFGRGGHSRLILDRLGAGGRLLALDRDPRAVAAAGVLADARFRCVQARFSRLAQVLDEAGVASVDGVLLDLGVSSPQLDDPARGFSFRRDGPLDMRMDPAVGESAAAWLARAEEDEIREVIRSYGEERFAKQIARAIVAARSREPVRTTRGLAAIVAGAVRTREPRQDPATRTFQALRLHVNQELEELALALPAALERLAPGGRLVVISFHSLEDRIVKRFLQEASSPPALPRRLPVRAADLPPPKMRLVGKPMRASEAEVAANPRSRSAIMRTAERI
jgi:16S rRNA (cytosine1402-N4)-methyltransferase